MKTLLLALLLSVPALAVESKDPAPTQEERIAALEAKVQNLERELKGLNREVDSNRVQTEKWIDELHDKIRHTAPVTPDWHQ